MVPPVNADTFLSTEGSIGLYTGTLHTGASHKAAIKQASFVVVLGRHEGVALGEQAVQGEMGPIVVSTEVSPLALPAPQVPPPRPYWSLHRSTCQRHTMVRRQKGLDSRQGSLMSVSSDTSMVTSYQNVPFKAHPALTSP